MHTISFQTFFVWAFEIVVDSWQFSMLLLYILWDDWPIFMALGSNEQLQQEFEYTLLKPDSHSWWISNMQSDTLEERFAIKFCFKLGKNATKTDGILWISLHTIKWFQAIQFDISDSIYYVFRNIMNNLHTAVCFKITNNNYQVGEQLHLIHI